MAWIDGATSALGELFVIDGHAPALARCHVLIIIEAECADVTNRAELAAFITATDTLAGVLDNDQAAPLGDVHDPVHVTGRAPHMHRHHRLGARTDRRIERLGIDGDAFVDIDDDRDGAHREDGGGGCHIGVGGDEHFIARAQAHRDHRRGQRVAAACREGKMLHAEIFGVAGFESIAFLSDPVTEERVGADHPRNCVNFLLAGDIHSLNVLPIIAIHAIDFLLERKSQRR